MAANNGFQLPLCLQIPPNLAASPHDMITTPKERLEKYLEELVIQDHLLALQALHRDAFDELGLAPSLRGYLTRSTSGGVAPTMKLPRKVLLERLLEGRVRVNSLLKMTYGHPSLSYTRGRLDLAAVYAQHGLWEQVRQITTEMMAQPISPAPEQQEISALAQIAARRLTILHATIRQEAVENQGMIGKKVLGKLLDSLPPADDVAIDGVLGAPSKMIASLRDFLAMPRSRLPLRQLATGRLMTAAVEEGAPGSATDTSMEDTSMRKPWGEVIAFLRGKCLVSKQWIATVRLGLLPQTRSILLLPFRDCDHITCCGIATPSSLINALPCFPAAARLASGSPLQKSLQESQCGFMISTHPSPLEMPIAQEEYESFVLLDCSLTLEAQAGMIRVQAFVLRGLAQVFLDRLPKAEDALSRGLQELRQLGLEGELPACELYNAIAQMMITKHESWIIQRKLTFKQEAERWLDTEIGRQTLKTRIETLQSKTGDGVRKAEQQKLETATRAHLIRKHVREAFSSDTRLPEMKRSLEAAYRYLVRSLDIMEERFGSNHPAVGAAALAIASVQNLQRDWEASREWLLRALRILEKCTPLPSRAVAFVRAQLGRVLQRLGHEEEARHVLSIAAEFHKYSVKRLVEESRNALASSLDVSVGGPGSDIPAVVIGNQMAASFCDVGPARNSALEEEVRLAESLMNQLIRLCSHSGDKLEGSQHSEELARMLELIYGWDSVQAGEAYRQVGLKCSQLGDWPRAVKFFTSSQQAFEAIYGKTDSRTLNITKLLESAKSRRNKRVDENNIAPISPSAYGSPLRKFGSPTSPLSPGGW